MSTLDKHQTGRTLNALWVLPRGPLRPRQSARRSVIAKPPSTSSISWRSRTSAMPVGKLPTVQKRVYSGARWPCDRDAVLDEPRAGMNLEESRTVPLHHNREADLQHYDRRIYKTWRRHGPVRPQSSCRIRRKIADGTRRSAGIKPCSCLSGRHAMRSKGGCSVSSWRCVRPAGGGALFARRHRLRADLQSVRCFQFRARGHGPAGRARPRALARFHGGERRSGMGRDSAGLGFRRPGHGDHSLADRTLRAGALGQSGRIDALHRPSARLSHRARTDDFGGRYPLRLFPTDAWFLSKALSGGILVHSSMSGVACCRLAGGGARHLFETNRPRVAPSPTTRAAQSSASPIGWIWFRVCLIAVFSPGGGDGMGTKLGVHSPSPSLPQACPF